MGINGTSYTKNFTFTQSGFFSANGAAFNILANGLGAGTYQLRFNLQTDSLSYAGIRIQFDQGMHYATPEPMTSSLMLTAGAALVWAARRRRKRQMEAR